jgi:hypothetical protein
VAEVFIRKAALFRTEKKADAAAGQMLVEKTRGLLKAADGMLQLTEADGGGSDDEPAIFDGFADGLELFSLGEQRLGANGGARFAKSQLVGVHHAKMEEAEVTHGAGGSADVKGIARSH